MKTTAGKAVVILSPGVHYERFKKYQLSNWKLLCSLLYLFAMRREASVTPHPSLQIVRALPVPTQVDGSGLDVDVHQVVNDLALNVILDAVDEKTATHIDYLDEWEIPGRRQDANDSSEGLQWGDITSKKNLSRELNFNFFFFFTCRIDLGPEAGSSFCSIQFFSGNPAWLQSCYSPGSPGRTPSLPA